MVLGYSYSLVNAISQIGPWFAGTIPAPILFGVAIDQSCRLWKTPCNSHGGKSCLFYNNNVMSDYMMGIGIACKGLACILFILSYILYKRFNDRRKGQTISQTFKDDLDQTIEVNSEEPVVAKDDLEQTIKVNADEPAVTKDDLEQTIEVNDKEPEVDKDK